MNITTEIFDGFDGAQLALHRMGAGRPVVLLHGLFSSAEVNWIKFGTAAKLAAAGFECLMPDLRVHGQSAAPHDAAAYPQDVLVRDAEALVAHLGLSDFDLVGFSLGSRTSARAVIAGMQPRRLVLSGMGLQGLAGWARRQDFFVDVIDRFGTIKRDDPAYFAQQFLKTMGTDRDAARLLLKSMADTNPAELAAITMPTLVLCGDQDNDNGSAEQLAEALPNARLALIPGTHMSSVTMPELGQELVKFLTAEG
ncbi:MAG: alpha/beta hydrolase [Novosphingobium sp. 17-62-19]|uniref:alpha/beta fold hydrolase n=1 Tax=Novosphingobium sp. 17-62-19 TaxID=1970406 RepID=UPI000BD26806|nr:alpha/beta hydrolase [Novosphingobium sp. 17-62-19]OZA17482.1 MAG: alpha/beta hydrolase [Novosphingobium sp. 17-62-19]OZA56148.1 MAG: alpha/beta hydrolase [Sphingomonadales bacterium 39-62-4]HQS95252.1 alpha/beta hydrolase [Novosphingobium sp.]